ncbi:MAG: thioredoxin [Aggregatilineales bacterium]
MSEAVQLTDETFQETLNQDVPVLLLVSNGEGLRSEFSVAFKKLAQEEKTITIARIDPTKNPIAAEKFNVGEKPVLIAWFNGQEVVRRSRPWGTDVPLAIEMLNAAYMQSRPQPVSDINTQVIQEDNNTMMLVENKPFAVTDATFQKEVIDYELPVVVDFWAEWCGPCRAVAPILDKLAEEFAGKIRIAKVNVDENPGLSQTFKIQSIPTIMILKQRNIVFSQPGALPEPAMRDLFQQLIDLEIPAQEPEEAEVVDEPAN